MTASAVATEKLDLSLLDSIVLADGDHDIRSLEALCIMEAVAWVAGERHSDRPVCASPTISVFLRSWNDAMNDADRQMLKPLIPMLVGTRGSDAQELQRSWMALDWYCRVSAPAWLRLAGLTAEAEAIEATAPIVDSASARAAQAALNTARSAAAAVWDAAGAAAGAAARAAAGEAAWDAAWAAGRAAAWAAGGAAAWAAAGDTLRSTVELLQKSAIELVERMIAVTAAEPVAP